MRPSRSDYLDLPDVRLHIRRWGNPDAMKAAFRAAGASGWMSKPFTPERLEAALKKLLGN